MIGLADTSHLGQPVSMLRYSKEQIKQALFTALASLEPDEIDIRESLVQGCLFLAQFIDDYDADIARRGQIAITSGDPSHPDLLLGEPAVKIINQIKSDMEDIKTEVYAYIRRKAEEQKETT